METLGNQIMPKLCQKYFCVNCDYRTSKKSSYDNHKLSSKHKKNVNVNVLETNVNKNMLKLCSSKYTCQNCDKEFKNRSGLWKHKQKCNSEEFLKPTNDNKDELIEYLVKENKEIKELILELAKKDTYSNYTTNNNSHNKTFNLQFFLNETCKDAMNIMDFVNSIQLQLSDLESVGKLGFVEGI